ncbi:MAG TPA: Ldh family oxidoreductase [Usitatibacter sp.]|jgi:LDH2 family malate/lactate/ureidoglycolate dehydrogenase|nr:Ldh family oxidoreductase [Usitatibacter sp.]
MTEAELAALAARALRGLGVDRIQAEDTARILVLGDLFGHHTHGVSRLESYGERLELGGIKARPDIRVERVAPGMLKVNGDNGLGAAVGLRALRAALEAARETGIAIAFAHTSNHFGACGPYCWLAAQEGFACIVGSNATPTIAPTGGRDTRVGNNPLAISVPRPGGDPIILDMAMSVVARAKLREALKRGESIPDTWATDREGRATSDPKAAIDGFLLPFGGYKGYGLAVMVDLLAGVLSGASYLTRVNSWIDEPQLEQRIGHFFVVIDTARLGSADWLADRVADFAAIVHDTPAADPSSPVRLPGEREMAQMKRQQREGIDVPAALVEKLEAWATRA